MRSTEKYTAMMPINVMSYKSVWSPSYFRFSHSNKTEGGRPEKEKKYFLSTQY